MKIKIFILCFIFVFVIALSGCKSQETVFEEFIVFQDTKSISRTLAKPQNVLHDGITARVKIVSKDEEEKTYQYPYSVYRIQITDDYHGGEKYDSETVYSILFVGTPEKQMYRQPPLEIGKEYVVLNLMTDNPAQRTFEASYWFEIKSQNGEEFIYPYFLDCSDFESKISITDEKENRIYQKGSHDGILRYLKKNRLENPTFDYKFKIKDFLAEFREIS